MITTEIYKGQGLGNQIWCYVTTRVIAKDKGYDFGVLHPELFLGTDFLNLDFGKTPTGAEQLYEEKSIVHPLNGSDIRLYDKDLVNVPDNTQINGCLQDEQYIAHRKQEVCEWLKVKPEKDFYDFSKEDICIINFRGSGYVQEKDFFLPRSYWKHAVANMQKINPQFKFIVITEDVKNAKKFFPNFDVFHFDIAKDYCVIKNAYYFIASNSSFAWFPAWTSKTLKYCIAPKYWARHNISDGYWSLGYNITSIFNYQDRTGRVQSYESCLAESKEYINSNKNLFLTTNTYQPGLSVTIRNLKLLFKTFSKESSFPYAAWTLFCYVILKSGVNIKRKIVRIALPLLHKNHA
jgi:hypothetical protein